MNWSLSIGWLKRMTVKRQPFSCMSCSLTLLLGSNLVMAEELAINAPLSEDFLEFIANMSVVDGEVIDTLDMIDIADNDMKSVITLDDKISPDKRLDESSNSLNVKANVEENKP